MIAEFVGGPIDGEVRCVETSVPIRFVWLRPIIRWDELEPDDVIVPADPLIYAWTGWIDRLSADGVERRARFEIQGPVF